MDQTAQPSSVSPESARAVFGTPEGDLTGKTLGDFEVLRRLGQGGMGQVYLAQQLSLKRKVALKIMRAELAANLNSLKRFKAEAEAVARITHANIVQVYAIGESDGLHYMALEYVDGRNLREYVAKKGPPELPLALSIMRQAAAALQRASEAGIVHRDIKPENILLTRKGEVKVADFGLSRCFASDQQPLHLTQSGVTMGTPLYMSPEQVQGQEVDPRSDVYSFGVTCYHMLAGQPPFRGQTAFDVAVQHVQARPAPLAEIRSDLPAELCAVVHKMMAKDPAERYQTGRDLLKDLARLRESLTSAGTVVSVSGLGLSVSSAPTAAVAPTVALPWRGWKRWLPVGVAASVVLALVAGVSIGLVQRNRTQAANRPGPAAEEELSSAQPVIGEREKFWLNAVKQPIDTQDPAQVRHGLTNRLELGLLYLEQRRWEDADRFFTSLVNDRPPKVYSTLGQAGHAIALAFQDKPAESNQAFLALAGKKVVDRDKILLYGNPRLRPWIAEALERNRANAQEIFPAELDLLRKLPPPGAAGPGANRKGNGGKATGKSL